MAIKYVHIFTNRNGTPSQKIQFDLTDDIALNTLDRFTQWNEN